MRAFESLRPLRPSRTGPVLEDSRLLRRYPHAAPWKDSLPSQMMRETAQPIRAPVRKVLGLPIWVLPETLWVKLEPLLVSAAPSIPAGGRLATDVVC
jgi:hypothetical protein